jgi:hypothetical protein
VATSRHLFFARLADALDVPGSLQNALAWVAQAQAEGGGAHWNPLNTTQATMSGKPIPGAVPFNDLGGGLHVWSYPNMAVGVEATAITLRQPAFGRLLAALRAGSSADAYWTALAASPWGTRPPGDPPLSLAAWLADVERHWYDYALAPVAGS